VTVAGRQGGGREMMNATVKQRQTGVGKVTWRPEKCYFAPEVKAANEITYDHVWDKLYPPLHLCKLL
jgi:hypothetical protein